MFDPTQMEDPDESSELTRWAWLAAVVVACGLAGWAISAALYTVLEWMK